MTVSIPFREDLHSDVGNNRGRGRNDPCLFPSFSGKTFIRTALMQPVRALTTEEVSIPFREDLHSDYGFESCGNRRRGVVSIPFREDLHSDIV